MNERNLVLLSVALSRVRAPMGRPFKFDSETYPRYVGKGFISPAASVLIAIAPWQRRMHLRGVQDGELAHTGMTRPKRLD